MCGKGFIEGEKVILAQPQTFMNLSGESVRSIADYYKIEPEDILRAGKLMYMTTILMMVVFGGLLLWIY